MATNGGNRGATFGPPVFAVICVTRKYMLLFFCPFCQLFARQKKSSENERAITHSLQNQTNHPHIHCKIRLRSDTHTFPSVAFTLRGAQVFPHCSLMHSIDVFSFFHSSVHSFVRSCSRSVSLSTNQSVGSNRPVLVLPGFTGTAKRNNTH